MTDAELKGLTMQALNLLKRDIETKQGRGWLLASLRSGGLSRMTQVEDAIDNILGVGWLNSGARKDRAFEVLRMCVTATRPVAVFFATPINAFDPTEKYRALPLDRRKALAEGGHAAQHRGVKDGYFDLRDALHCIGQTSTIVCMARQNIDRGPEPPAIQLTDQDHFDGRLKLYGKPK